MNNTMKKMLIPALVATIVTGGGFSIANAANLQDKPTALTEENDAQDQAELAKQVTITEEEATKTALKKVPGTITDIELENENGTIVYGIEIVAKDGSQQDVKIDAKTGKIVKVELEDDENEIGEDDQE